MRKRILAFLICVLVLTSCNLPRKENSGTTAAPASLLAATQDQIPPSQTPTITPTPSPTPIPAARVEIAEQALFLGDYELARREFQAALAGSDDPEIQAAAAMGIGRALHLQRNYPGAIEALKGMITAHAGSSSLPAAYFFLGRSYQAQQAHAQAAEAYTRYLELQPGVLDNYVQELRGDAYVAAGNASAAVEAYQAAIAASPDGNTIWTEIKLAQAYTLAGEFTQAIEKYIEIYEKTNSEYIKAHTNLLMGQVYTTIGQPEQAYARYHDSIAHYPAVYDTYTGLVALVNAGVPVNDLDRGLVDYYAGQYGLALDAFNRFETNSTDHDGTVYYFRGLTLRALDVTEDAIADWDYLIQNYPNDRYYARAWKEKAFTLWAYQDKHEEAANTLLQFIEQSPDAPEAPEYLYEAARILERDGQLVRAAETWERLINTYPAYSQSYRGLFLAGISYYRAKDYPKALLTFQRALVLASDPGDQAAAYLWMGKTHQASGDTVKTREAWQQAAQTDPTGYYSERAKELLVGQEPFTSNFPIDLGYDLNKERSQAEAWLRTTFELPPETSFDGLGNLTDNIHMQRGMAFWDLGLYEQARTEFETVRTSVAADPVATYRLMNYLLDLGIYRSAILASRQILDLANLDDLGTLEAPEYFNHIRFGVYYKDLVLQASEAEKFTPLFLLSVIRQESLFEGFAISNAGARGLMQIMPATGQEIASSLNWPLGYSSEDLYRPVISIPMGAKYLSRQRDYFGGNMYAALAAYNGGPGNTIIWNELAGDDPDLLLEVIRASETQTYIKRIFEFYNLYRLIYGRGF